MALLERAAVLARNRDAGAAELLAQFLPVLDEAVRVGGNTPLAVTRVVLEGQRAMAPLWHAAAAAVADTARPGTFARVRAELMRAPRALVRAASIALRDLLADERAPLVLTLSYSSGVAAVLGEVAQSTPLRVACAEGRPRFEGRRLASELAQAGVETTLVVDAALTTLLSDSSCVVVGADAIAADHWINKVGTFGLAAAAALAGVPVYVVASRDKFVPAVLGSQLEVNAPLDPREVWPDPPRAVLIRNLYFEATPVELATRFLTDAGPLSSADLAAAVERRADHLAHLLGLLASSG